jgi:hypothetical protein
MENETEVDKQVRILQGDTEVNFKDILTSIVRQLKDKDAIEKSKGKIIVGKFMDSLMEENDPFTRAIATLGGQQGLNTVGVLLFVSFQLGYTFASNGYSAELVDAEPPKQEEN